jgi:hypothetical protein
MNASQNASGRPARTRWRDVRRRARDPRQIAETTDARKRRLGFGAFTADGLQGGHYQGSGSGSGVGVGRRPGSCDASAAMLVSRVARVVTSRRRLRRFLRRSRRQRKSARSDAGSTAPTSRRSGRRSRPLLLLGGEGDHRPRAPGARAEAAPRI